MKILLIVSLGLAAALAGPPKPEDPVLAEEDQRPLLGGGPDGRREWGKNPVYAQRSEVEARAPLEPGAEPVLMAALEVRLRPEDPEGQPHGGPGLDAAGQQIRASEEHLAHEEAAGLHQDCDYGGEEEARVEAAEEVAGPVQSRLSNATRWSLCTGVLVEGKCYIFFKEAKKASDAEFFCQDQFHGGHLASITSPELHRAVMNMMLQQNGAHTRTWVGGLRYLDTGRFIWLDGSSWGYADWLSGEPNHTAGKEHCVELLPHGSGKFNDFTCWEPQAFICSFPYW